ncbi:uncharacterized protein BDR25DRAFT_317733 [Lindgomyces ingoldianus]|uniref:Uncharacterized protein n=1 Tax=Lindgomyces ingoldianus TaxID=673940 RepID=A0ACB6QJM6_9PLEO|nr:uncharacterized protein BDR25DRAFT_317733 [Lindgomyces ingoldianus]KAF2466340.1 hypothetical protein BDR25DRAFT_317733 [Lindgomyces ingoldianus]
MPPLAAVNNEPRSILAPKRRKRALQPQAPSRIRYTENLSHNTAYERPCGYDGTHPCTTAGLSDSSTAVESAEDANEESGLFGASSRKRLACPYYKHDIDKYRHIPTCLGPGWASVHRLKEHIYRRHAMPIHCPRCYCTFKTESDLRGHQRALEGCTVQEAKGYDGYDKEQEKKLKSKKRCISGKTEEDKWNDIYMILFPEAHPSAIPSPYYEHNIAVQGKAGTIEASVDITQFKEHLRDDIPSRAMRSLQHLCHENGTELHSLQIESLGDIVRFAVEDAIASFHMALAPATKAVARYQTAGQDAAVNPAKNFNTNPNVTDLNPPRTSLDLNAEGRMDWLETDIYFIPGPEDDPFQTDKPFNLQPVVPPNIGEEIMNHQQPFPATIADLSDYPIVLCDHFNAGMSGLGLPLQQPDSSAQAAFPTFVRRNCYSLQSSYVLTAFKKP